MTAGRQSCDASVTVRPCTPLAGTTYGAAMSPNCRRPGIISGRRAAWMGRSFQEKTMLKTLGAAFGAVLLVGAATVAQAAGTISGAGATFPAPVYAKWAEAYKAQTGTSLNYQAIGSGGGIKQITASTVDFGGNDSVQWPVGLGGKGNDGVAAFVKQTPGAIGYVEYAYAKQNAMTYALMQNKAGKFVSPDAKNFAAAAAGAKWSAAPGFYLLLLDQPAAEAWPITGATFILVHNKQTDAAKGREVLAFFDWCYKNGDAA